MFIVPITKMDGLASVNNIEKSSVSKQVGAVPFKNVLEEAVKEADQAVKDTQQMDVDLAAGRIDNLHTALIQAEKSAAAIEFTTQLTSKAVSAYNQIMGMQV